MKITTNIRTPIILAFITLTLAIYLAWLKFIPTIEDNLTATVVILHENTGLMGAGIVISPNYILTANHVALTAVDGVPKIKFNDSRPPIELSPDYLAAFDAINDLAVIQLDKPTTIKPVELNCDYLPNVGDDIYMIGHPHGYPWVTGWGKVSSAGWITTFYGKPDPAMDHAMTMQMPVKRGNSGGGVFDSGDQLVGLVVRTYFDFAQGYYLDIAMAIRVDKLCKFLDDNKIPYNID